MGHVAWTTVRGFGSVKYFNISYFVLAVVPVMHELAQRQIPVLADFKVFPETLKYGYAASLFFAVAILVYQYFCPTEIKRFGHSDEYLENQYEIHLRTHPDKRPEVMLAQLDKEIDRETISEIHRLSVAMTNPASAVIAKRDLKELIESRFGDCVQRYLLRKFDRLNASKCCARWICFLLYAAGTLILIVLLAIRTYDLFS